MFETPVALDGKKGVENDQGVEYGHSIGYIFDVRAEEIHLIVEIFDLGGFKLQNLNQTMVKSLALIQQVHFFVLDTVRNNYNNDHFSY